MSTIDQAPSTHAVFFTLVDNDGATQELFWDYLDGDNYFTWGKGVFLVWKNADGINQRIVGVDQYPSSQAGGDPVGKLIMDCIRKFNAKITELFLTSDADPHPVDDEVYRALVDGLVWNTQTQQFDQ